MSSIHPDPEILPPALADAWRADTASTSDLRRGYARFVRQRSRRVAKPRVAGFVLRGLILGVGLAQAASLVPDHWFGQSEVESSVRNLPPAPLKSPAPASESRSAAPGASAAAEPAGTTKMKTEAVAHAEALPTPLAAVETPATPQSEVQRHWQRAAAAMRDGDFPRAQSTLLEIEHSAGGAEREAARLARAQLLASHGQTALASMLASTLAEQAESGLVRDKARALSARLSKTENVDRSTEIGAAVKGP